MKCTKLLVCTLVKLALGLSGCTGQLAGNGKDHDGPSRGGGDGDDNDDGFGGAAGTPPPGVVRFPNATLVDLDRDQACNLRAVPVTRSPRLSVSEYLNTLSDLFPGRSLPAVDLSDDELVFGFDNINLGIVDSRVREFGKAAFDVAASVTRDDVNGLLGCDPASDACAESFVSDFAGRAYRRPLLAEEKTKLLAFYQKQKQAISPRAAVELTIAAVLQAPQFLYRLETAGVGETSAQRVKGHEMASRLSYLVWGTMPDEDLHNAASKGELDTNAGVAAALDRMLAKNEGQAAARQMSHFAQMWLHLSSITSESTSKSASLFPQWDVELATDMVEESRKFVETVFQDSEGTFSDLLTSRKAFIKSGVGEVLGQSAGAAWQATDLPDGQRAGLLTRPAFLAATGKETWGSPPLRGVEVMRQLLCIKPVSPPPDIDLTVRESAGPGEVLTNRQRFEEKTKQSACWGCHSQIDGLGMPFESYDAIGQFRDKDAGKAVDASSEIVGVGEGLDGKVENAIELSQRLASADESLFCFAANWNRFAQGRLESRDEWCHVDAIFDTAKAKQGNLRALLEATTKSHSFTNRLAD